MEILSFVDLPNGDRMYQHTSPQQMTQSEASFTFKVQIIRIRGLFKYNDLTRLNAQLTLMRQEATEGLQFKNTNETFSNSWLIWIIFFIILMLTSIRWRLFPFFIVSDYENYLFTNWPFTLNWSYLNTSNCLPNTFISTTRTLQDFFPLIFVAEMIELLQIFSKIVGIFAAFLYCFTVKMHQ